jgi:hypothetical protein
MKDLPDNWGVIALPGARVSDVNKVLNDDPLPETVERIVVAVGINDDETPLNKFNEDIADLCGLLRKYNGYYMEIPCFLNADGVPDSRIEERNIVARDLIDTRYMSFDIDYVPINDDLNGHHYDVSTAVKVMEELKVAFLN